MQSASRNASARLQDSNLADSRLVDLDAGIARRLSGVCANLSPEDFDALVRKVADFTRRWANEDPYLRNRQR